MAKQKITFEDKVATRQSNLPRENSVTDQDINHIKGIVNYNASNAMWTVEIGSSLSRTFLSPELIKIVSVESNVDQDIEIEVNGSPYTLGNSISKWAEITVSADQESSINLNVSDV